MSRRAQKGTAVPAGTGLGNLWANHQAKRDRFPVAAGDSRRGRQIICAVEFVLRPTKVKYVSPGIRKKTSIKIVRNPFSSLTRATGADERICDGVAYTQIAVVRTAWSRVGVSWHQGIDGERCKRDKSTRFVEACN